MVAQSTPKACSSDGGAYITHVGVQVSDLRCQFPALSYLWLVGNGGMGYNYNYYYYHSSILY